MLTTTLIKLFDRDLEKLKQEIEAYKAEEDLWIVTNEISNSAGNLCLHLIGNLNHFIGAILGNTGYIRQRDLEFSQTNIPKSKMIGDIDNALVMVKDVLGKLTVHNLQEQYELKVFGEAMSTEFFLTHLLTHLAYHLGQINYHRRLLSV
ncbi:MAG: DinB family protein [Winogradskyella sp.]